jgi:Holliday junction resolvase
MLNSCVKGKVGEREWAEFLRSHGFAARRGRQFSGSPDSPDVVSELPYHFEVKRVENLNLVAAVQKATEDAGGQVPVIAHRRNLSEWLVTMKAKDWIELVKTWRKLEQNAETLQEYEEQSG